MKLPYIFFKYRIFLQDVLIIFLIFTLLSVVLWRRTSSYRKIEILPQRAGMDMPEGVSREPTGFFAMLPSRINLSTTGHNPMKKPHSIE